MKKLQEYIFGIYGNSYERYSPTQIINRLIIAIGRLGTAVRKNPQAVNEHFAHCVAWAFAAAHHLTINVADSMRHKYWANNLSAESNTPGQWQTILTSRYRRNNCEKGGLYFCLTRLFEEATETLEVVCKLGEIDLDNPESEEVYIRYREEIADLFGWLFAVADMFGIQLGQTVNEHYKGGCSHCKTTPCECPPEHIVLPKRKRVQADTKVVPRSPAQ